jgi:hypothetical protein
LHASQSESSDELRNIDEGTLVLTTKRLAFLGSLRTSNVKLDDIISVQSFADGVQIHRAPGAGGLKKSLFVKFLFGGRAAG